MSLDIKTEGKHTVVKFEKELNIYNSATARKEIFGLIKDDDHINSVVADMGSTTYIDSSGIALLIQMQKMLKEKNGNLYILKVKPDVMTILKLLSLDKRFLFFDEVAKIP